MRLKIFLISLTIFFWFSGRGYACTNYECPPEEYLLFRVFDPRTLITVDKGVPQLQESNDPDVRKYLELARSCERLRKMQNSKWYYPTKEDNVLPYTLEDVLEEALEYRGSKLKDRYALQAARAMFSLCKYRELIEWWAKVKDGLMDEAISRSIYGYVAGALFRTGEEEKALEYYTSIADIESITFCLKQQKDYAGDRALLEYLSAHFPDKPYVLSLLQDYITRVEAYSGFHDSRGTTEACCQMCMRASAKSQFPAPWLYAAAFLKYQLGEHYVASNILSTAEGCDATPFIKESIKVLRILIDASISTYNKAYEEQLLEELSWLDAKICGNITDEVKSTTAEIFKLQFGYSYYYWNDMMRKIVLGTVVPRMIEAGKAPLALLLANYADNRLLMLVNKVKTWQHVDSKYIYVDLSHYRNSNRHSNRYDYSNHYFRMLDSASISSLLKYESLLDCPSSSIEKFLHKRAYTEKDFHYELIGTKYLRAMEYKEAVHYLGKVSSGYQGRLNTSIFMEYDPFQLEPSYLPNNSYKLRFARKMVDYERIMRECMDKDIKGEAMIKMGLGVKSSFGHCWALTHYSKSEYNPWFEAQQTLDKIAYAHTLIAKGLKTIDNPELAATYYRDFYQWKTVIEKYPYTAVAEEIRTSCDNLVDYTYKQPRVRDAGSYVNMFCW